MASSIRWSATIAACIVFFSVAGSPDRALADCATEEQVFAGGPTQAYGTTNNIRLTDRALNTACGTPLFEAVSTANVTLGGAFGNWVEVGWEEHINGGTGAHEFNAFTEWGLAGNIKGQQVVGVSCIKLSNAGNYYKWRVNNVAGTNDWTLHLNCGSGFAQITRYNGTGYHSGLATGEAARLGGPVTGMSDSQDTLKYKNSSGTWNSWTSNFCYLDTATNWYYSHVSSTAYKVLNGSGSC